MWLHGYWCYDWFDEVIQVKAIDRRQHRITLAEPHVYGLQQGNPSPRRFRAINVLEELDQPGEYYIDCAKGVLFFWPPAELSGARIVLGTLDAPVVALNDASYVVVRGFIVEASQGDGLAISGGTANRIQACVVRNVRQMGIRVSGGTDHRVEACDIHETGTGGILLGRRRPQNAYACPSRGDQQPYLAILPAAVDRRATRFNSKASAIGPRTI